MIIANETLKTIGIRGYLLKLGYPGSCRSTSRFFLVEGPRICIQFQLLVFIGAALLLLLLQVCTCSSECSESFKCGDDAYSYPFWGNNRPTSCGVHCFELDCRFTQTQIDINYQTCVVLNISEANQIMTIVRSDVLDLSYGGYYYLPTFLNDTTIYNTRFEYAFGTLNYTLFYGCPFNVSSESGGIYCYDVNGTRNSLYVTVDSVGSNQNTYECQGAILIPIVSTVPILVGVADPAHIAPTYTVLAFFIVIQQILIVASFIVLTVNNTEGTQSLYQTDSKDHTFASITFAVTYKHFTDASLKVASNTGGLGFLLLNEANQPIFTGHKPTIANSTEEAEGKCIS
ncbi:hypothetical protein GIB67_018014 [Kingdonia uniflora]|uniref:Wall-associated receptor kinase galacturonan-binding domain-containing protein n=1 Tax=Kingdonia uniflora TaxID=39325 RepID=A0A7J7NWP8_9MAGN|nr:hypothetical protein GIB67_018014 [Kingdonia uniflora]